MLVMYMSIGNTYFGGGGGGGGEGEHNYSLCLASMYTGAFNNW